MPVKSVMILQKVKVGWGDVARIQALIYISNLAQFLQMNTMAPGISKYIMFLEEESCLIFYINHQ